MGIIKWDKKNKTRMVACPFYLAMYKCIDTCK